MKKSLSDDSIPLLFSIYGLSGWCESEADLYIAIPLIKTLLYRDLGYDKYLLLYIISSLVSELKEVDAEFVIYLIKESLDFQKGDKITLQLRKIQKHLLMVLSAKQ
ncbi:hypothetical protein [Chryseobacterium carnipullorum]|uniref:Uncharacterized protein n=1 Tax=Chryseobacterium carnipullorum TaxID=1124835 RepID=A0A376E5A0_CHRCU|nr:hypothetical protein [Chryseobacterium carnipullorum]STD01267.1 Uncharacterised protein [Chryseobacterium carnipullorum]